MEEPQEENKQTNEVLDNIVDRITRCKSVGINFHILPYFEIDVKNENQKIEFSHEYFVSNMFSNYLNNYERHKANPESDGLYRMNKSVGQLGSLEEVHLFIFKNTSQENLVLMLDAAEDLMERFSEVYSEKECFDVLVAAFGVSIKPKKSNNKKEAPENDAIIFGGQKISSFKAPNPPKFTSDGLNWSQIGITQEKKSYDDIKEMGAKKPAKNSSRPSKYVGMGKSEPMSNADILKVYGESTLTKVLMSEGQQEYEEQGSPEVEQEQDFYDHLMKDALYPQTPENSYQPMTDPNQF